MAAPLHNTAFWDQTKTNLFPFSHGRPFVYLKLSALTLSPSLLSHANKHLKEQPPMGIIYPHYISHYPDFSPLETRCLDPNIERYGLARA